MSGEDIDEMPAFPGRTIKFGTFNVTSQVHAALIERERIIQG